MKGTKLISAKWATVVARPTNFKHALSVYYGYDRPDSRTEAFLVKTSGFLLPSTDANEPVYYLNGHVFRAAEGLVIDLRAFECSWLIDASEIQCGFDLGQTSCLDWAIVINVLTLPDSTTIVLGMPIHSETTPNFTFSDNQYLERVIFRPDRTRMTRALSAR